MGTLTLFDFQQGKSAIPLHEHIYLLENPRFYGCYYACLATHDITRVVARTILRRRSRRFLFAEYKLGLFCLGFLNRLQRVRVPQKDGVLFFGEADASFNNLAGLTTLYRAIAERGRNFSYTVVVGKGDYSFGPSEARFIPANVTRLFANNVTVTHEKVGYLPVGRDFRNAQLFARVGPRTYKPQLCYCNFSLNTHPVRKMVYESVKAKRFVTFQHMGRYADYKVSRAEFYENLAASKFALCPRGAGMDTYRMWDALYCGTIPIVVREAAFQRELEDLPVLFIETPEDYARLGREYLEDIYRQMLHNTYNYEKLTLSYWLRRIEGGRM